MTAMVIHSVSYAIDVPGHTRRPKCHVLGVEDVVIEGTILEEAVWGEDMGIGVCFLVMQDGPGAMLTSDTRAGRLTGAASMGLTMC